jgi:hypothetical protein
LQGMMRRLAAWLIGPLMLSSVVFTAAPAVASPARPSLRAGTVAGQYTLYGKYGKSKTYIFYSLTLFKDHTGTDHVNDTIVWSTSGKDLTMVFDGGLWTYLGHKTKAGFNSLASPGTLSNINGGTGLWYAVKLP